MSATKLIKCCQELESACAQDGSMPAIEELILEVEEHITAVNETLHSPRSIYEFDSCACA